MSYRTVLALNFDAERLRLLKHVSLISKAAVIAVTEEEKDETVGELLGLSEDEIKEIAALAQESEEGVAIPEDAKPVTKEAIVLCGFDRSAAGELLEAIKRGKLKHVPLKAMLTPNNISWTLRTVLYELNEEHEQFKKMGSK